MEVHLRTKVWLVNCQLFGAEGLVNQCGFQTPHGRRHPIHIHRQSWCSRFGDLEFWESLIMNLPFSNPDKMRLVMEISNTHTDCNNNDGFHNKDHNQSASNG